MTPSEFIAKWRVSELKESSAAQEHFIDLCRLLGEQTPAEDDPKGDHYCFERGARKDGGGKGWADVWKRHHFAWEYKGKHKNLDAAFRQLRQYTLALDNPPLLIVSDMALFRIYTNWTNSVSETHEFALEDLVDAANRDKLKWAMSDPERLRPGESRQDITERAAATFALLAHSLRRRGHDPQAVAHFINRLVFCMFAEDVGLLPDQMFTRMLEQARKKPEDFSTMARDLFGAMSSGGRIGFEAVAWFNGGLFDDNEALPLGKAEIETALAAAGLDWSEIDPSILGTLFERGLDPDKRSQLGAHYTDRDKIMCIIDPVITRPLLAEWERVKEEINNHLESGGAAKSASARRLGRNRANQLLGDFLTRLRGFQVLDPACGSGNFLYLALQALKDVEHRVQLEADAMGLQRGFPRVGPANVKGIEINPYAGELNRHHVTKGEAMKKVVVVCLLCSLLGCGGGGGGGNVRPAVTPDPPVVEPEPEPEPEPQPTGILGSSDVPTAERVVEYLQTHASGGPWQSGPDYSWSHDPGLVRFATPPTVRLAAGMSERERAISMYAIALVNRALPYDQHLQLGPDAPVGVAWDSERGLPDIPDRQIFIEFIDGYPRGGRPGSEALGHQSTITEYDAQQGRWEKKRLRAAAVEMSSVFFRGRPDWQPVSVLVHELIHGLGFAGHPGHDFSDSIMENAWFRLDGSLPDIDIAALQALFLKLPDDTEPEDLSVQSLGAWDGESTDITGDLGPIAFGVRHANDVSVPFTAGPEPSTPLAESGLSGTATWRGYLLGFTPELRTVAGGATVGVDLATMHGTAKFTNLRAFSVLAAPMPEGGMTWGDGTIGYDIRVESNYLYSTGGDAGVVSGSFYGDDHGYVGGTVERSDLTAAFGGTR